MVNKFVKMKYPAVYKTDKTDCILFAELVDFDVCPYLLGNGSEFADFSSYEKYGTKIYFAHPYSS